VKNPNAATDLEHLPPEMLVEDILRKEERIAEILREIRGVLGERP
jgi:type I restriction enzyme M protein